MATFIAIGYGDRAGYEATSSDVLDRAHDHDAALAARGALLGIAGTPVQVRNHDGDGVKATTGSFLTSKLPLAGFGVIEADSLDDAIALVGGTPCAVAHGVVEVWPLEQASG